MKAKIVQMVDGKLIATLVEAADVIAAMEVRGATFTKLSRNWQAEADAGRTVPRPMLWDQPQFTGFNGPMYDKDDTGADCLRYEDVAAYDRLSA